MAAGAVVDENAVNELVKIGAVSMEMLEHAGAFTKELISVALNLR